MGILCLLLLAKMTTVCKRYITLIIFEVALNLGTTWITIGKTEDSLRRSQKRVTDEADVTRVLQTISDLTAATD